MPIIRVCLPAAPRTIGTTSPRPAPRVRDDLAYLLPMGTFLVLTQFGVWWKDLYPLTYVVKTAVVAALLVALRKYFTKIRWDYWWLGGILGVVGVFQWVGMQLWLQSHVPQFFKPPSGADLFNPLALRPEWAVWPFVAVRLAGAVLVVPVMEELFWRDFAWRQVVAPNDFKLARVGEWDWKAFVIVPLIFALVHGNWWLTAVVWAFMIGGLLLYTRSLGACIVMHAVTNLLLGAYVLRYHDWAFW